MTDRSDHAGARPIGPVRAAADEIAIEDLRREHLYRAVELHMRAFPDFFLTFLGRSFLRQLYLSYCGDPTTVALAAVSSRDGNLLGVVVGPLEPAGFFKKILLRRWWRFGLAATGAVLRRPTIVPRILRAVRYRGDAPDDGGRRALLASIAVSPEAQGTGVGKLLTQGFLDRVRAVGLPGAFLTTDAERNDAVNAFYQRVGWKRESTFTTLENRRMFRYTFDFEARNG